MAQLGPEDARVVQHVVVMLDRKTPLREVIADLQYHQEMGEPFPDYEEEVDASD